jgi:S1-C subfamily serine protease
MSRTARLISLLILLWVGCATEPGPSPDGAPAPAPRFSVWLSTSEPEGAVVLHRQARHRGVVADYLAENGSPDRILLTEHGGLRAIYLDRDLFVTFKHGSTLSASRRVPPRVLQRLDAGDRARVLAARAAGAEAASGGESAGESLVIGSCFVVSPDGLVLTVDHAARRAGAIGIRLADGSGYSAEVAERLPESDLALLRIDGEGLEYLPVTDRVRLGEPVFTIGFPAVELLGVAPKFSDGAISGLQAGPGNERLLLTSVPVMPGNSGGPLVNERGEVLGVVVGNAEGSRFLPVTGQAPQNISYAIRASEAEALFEPPEPPRPASSREEAVQRAQRASCLIVVRGAELKREPAGQ